MGDRTTHRVDFVQLHGKPATNQKPRDKITIDKTRRLESRSRYRHDFVKASRERDPAAADLYQTLLDRARARPEKLPTFQDITTVRRDYRGIPAIKASTTKPRWSPAKYRPFQDATETKVILTLSSVSVIYI